MPINREGVEQLKEDMRAHAEQYAQSTFGVITECGTMQCMAGFCRLRDVGSKHYRDEVLNVDASKNFGLLCINSAIQQLGIVNSKKSMDIFCHASFWPSDLSEAYRMALKGAERVEVACAALDRLQEDGSIADL